MDIQHLMHFGSTNINVKPMRQVFHNILGRWRIMKIIKLINKTNFRYNASNFK